MQKEALYQSNLKLLKKEFSTRKRNSIQNRLDARLIALYDEILNTVNRYERKSVDA